MGRSVIHLTSPRTSNVFVACVTMYVALCLGRFLYLVACSRWDLGSPLSILVVLNLVS